MHTIAIGMPLSAACNRRYRKRIHLFPIMGWGDFLERLKKFGIYLFFTLVFSIGFHIVLSSLEITLERAEKPEIWEPPKGVNDFLRDGILNTFLPVMTYQEGEKVLPDLLPSLVFEKCNLAGFVRLGDKESDNFSYETVLLQEALDEERSFALEQDFETGAGEVWREEGDEAVQPESGGEGGEPAGEGGGGESAESGQASSDNGQGGETVAAGSANTAISYSMEQLASYDFLLQKLYTVDKTTSIGSSQLDGRALMERSLKLDKNAKGPLVLIYHTHSQETFADSVEGDANTSIVGVGAHLKNILEEQYGISVLHVTTEFDVVNGKLDRNRAYSQAEKSIKKILADNPSIQVVLDVHRDGVGSQTRLVTEIDGRKTAQIMFFNGLSRTNTAGDIAYLKNPNLTDNLAFSLQMKVKADALYPNFTRKIYLKGYRYNLHLAGRAMLVEVGAQTNTVEEANNAMIPLADLLYKVLFE